MVIKFLRVSQVTSLPPGNCTAKLLSLVNKYNFVAILLFLHSLLIPLINLPDCTDSIVRAFTYKWESLYILVPLELDNSVSSITPHDSSNMKITYKVIHIFNFSKIIKSFLWSPCINDNLKKPFFRSSLSWLWPVSRGQNRYRKGEKEAWPWWDHPATTFLGWRQSSLPDHGYHPLGLDPLPGTLQGYPIYLWRKFRFKPHTTLLFRYDDLG